MLKQELMIDQYFAELKSAFEKNADPAKAHGSVVRDQFHFLGSKLF
jgi:hypothetical protein